MGNSGQTPEQENNELRKRRERLAALKSKRETASSAPMPDDGAGMPGADGPGGFGAAMGGGEAGPKRARQRKMLMKVYKVLTQTPEDENGKVPETPFTQSGVARLMQILRDRAADPSQPGAKVAENLLNFINPSEGESATSSGASVEKLQMLSRRVDALRGKGGAARPGGW